MMEFLKKATGIEMTTVTIKYVLDAFTAGLNGGDIEAIFIDYWSAMDKCDFYLVGGMLHLLMLPFIVILSAICGLLTKMIKGIRKL